MEIDACTKGESYRNGVDAVMKSRRWSLVWSLTSIVFLKGEFNLTLQIENYIPFLCNEI